MVSHVFTTYVLYDHLHFIETYKGYVKELIKIRNSVLIFDQKEKQKSKKEQLIFLKLLRFAKSDSS